jgi:hypothetical protein
MIHAGQIYLAKNAQLGKAKYRRPCLVIRTNSSGAVVSYFSTKFDLMESGDLLLNKNDPNFPSTGLEDSSYLMTDRDIPVESEFFDGAKYLGCVSGDMKKKVEEWWGEVFPTP